MSTEFLTTLEITFTATPCHGSVESPASNALRAATFSSCTSGRTLNTVLVRRNGVIEKSLSALRGVAAHIMLTKQSLKSVRGEGTQHLADLAEYPS